MSVVPYTKEGQAKLDQITEELRKLLELSKNLKPLKK